MIPGSMRSLILTHNPENEGKDYDEEEYEMHDIKFEDLNKSEPCIPLHAQVRPWAREGRVKCADSAFCSSIVVLLLAQSEEAGGFLLSSHTRSPLSFTCTCTVLTLSVT